EQLEKVSNPNTSGIEGKNSDDVLVSEFTLRGAIPQLARSKSLKQPKISDSFLKTLRKKIGEVVSKFLIYERLVFQLASSPWLYNLIQVSIEVGRGVKLPTPYQVSDVYLELDKGTNFWKSVDVSSVRSRDVEFYYSLLDSVVEEIGESYIIQIVTDYEAA
ncbi:hypothetical protein Gogos_000862, partial [Gossypium gossypioides]|nr:hypothetical protein [Gossypium gossypioides]